MPPTLFRRLHRIVLWTAGLAAAAVPAGAITVAPAGIAVPRATASGAVGADLAGDPVAFLVALEIVAAHYIAGRDAYRAGAGDLAAAMFARPMAETYAALEPALVARGATPFLPAIETAVEAALDGRGEAEVAAKAEAVLAALRRAAARAPGGGEGAVPVQVAALAALVDRAAALFARAQAGDDGFAYLDGYGTSRAAQEAAARWLPGIAAASADTAVRLREALGLLARAYPAVTPPGRGAPGPDEVLAAVARFAAPLAAP